MVNGVSQQFYHDKTVADPINSCPRIKTNKPRYHEWQRGLIVQDLAWKDTRAVINYDWSIRFFKLLQLYLGAFYCAFDYRHRHLDKA